MMLSYITFAKKLSSSVMIQNDRDVSLIPAPTDSTTDRDPRQRNNPDNAKMRRNVSGNATCQARLPCWDYPDDSTVLPISRYRRSKATLLLLSTGVATHLRSTATVGVTSIFTNRYSTSKQLQNMRKSLPDQNLTQRTLLSEDLISLILLTSFPLDLGEKH